MNEMFECKNVNLPEQELKFSLTLNGKEQNLLFEILIIPYIVCLQGQIKKKYFFIRG